MHKLMSVHVCVPVVRVRVKQIFIAHLWALHTLQMVFMTHRQRTHYTIPPPAPNWNFKILVHFMPLVALFIFLFAMSRTHVRAFWLRLRVKN